MYSNLLLTYIFRYSSNQRLSRAKEPDHFLPKTRYPWWCNNPWPPNHQFPGWPSWCGEPRGHRLPWTAPDNLPVWNTRTSHCHRWKPQCSSSVIQKPQILYPLFLLFLFLKWFFFLAPWFVTTPHDGGLPRVLCVEGQFACWSFGCVDSKQVCDGKQDCLDGSDEERCGEYHQQPLRLHEILLFALITMAHFSVCDRLMSFFFRNQQTSSYSTDP